MFFCVISVWPTKDLPDFATVDNNWGMSNLNINCIGKWSDTLLILKYTSYLAVKHLNY